MSANGQSFHLFGLFPYEIRLQIWEAAVFDLPSRVCGLDNNILTQFYTGKFDWKDRSGLVVSDLPSLRYVCQESRQVALKYASKIGWTVSGKEPPYRPYDPQRDVLYIGHIGNIEDINRPEFSSFRRYQSSLSEPEGYKEMATTSMREARHIVLSRSLFEFLHKDAWTNVHDEIRWAGDSMLADLLQIFKQLDRISVALSQFDLADFVASSENCTWPPWPLPQRPCKLEPLAGLHDDAHLEEPLRSLYRQVQKNCGNFVETVDTMSARVRVRRVPVPMITQVYQLSQDTKLGYKWEELPDTSSNYSSDKFAILEETSMSWLARFSQMVLPSWSDRLFQYLPLGQIWGVRPLEGEGQEFGRWLGSVELPG